MESKGMSAARPAAPSGHGSDVLDRLRGGRVVSCQPVPGGPMDRPDIVAAFALAALAGGAVGVRIEGVANVVAVRAVTRAPIIGLIKRDLADSPVRITPYLADVDALADVGADVIAVDAADRSRPVPTKDLIARILSRSRSAMADCAAVADAEAAWRAGAVVLGSTLSGYTGGLVPTEPDYDLVAALARIGLAPGHLARIKEVLAPLPPVRRPRLAPAALGPQAGLVGAADLALAGPGAAFARTGASA
jgi:N-acylglucosamine-6-phosphate 2-epimerase